MSDKSKSWTLNEDGTLTVTLSAQAVQLLNELAEGTLSDHPLIKGVVEMTKESIESMQAVGDDEGAAKLQEVLNKLISPPENNNYGQMVGAVISATHKGMVQARANRMIDSMYGATSGRVMRPRGYKGDGPYGDR
jgi:ATP-dependent protease HslVU (ClpYQ) ATPase subunit